MAARPPGKTSHAIEERVAELHASGLGRNSIARELGIAAATVTRICQERGLLFDRAATRQALAARRIDCAALRTELEQQLLEDAQRLRAQLWQPHEYRDHGGRDFVEVKWTRDEPNPVDKKHLMQAASAAIDRSIRLAELDKGGEIAEARTMLGQLLQQLQVVAGDYDPAAAT